jgi:hypothetical protein
LQSVYDLQREIEATLAQLVIVTSELSVYAESLRILQGEIKKATLLESQKNKAATDLKAIFNTSFSYRPGFLSRLFRTAKYKSWLKNHEGVAKSYKAAKVEWEITKAEQSQIQRNLVNQENLVKKLHIDITGKEQKIRNSENKITEIFEKFPGTYLNSNFFKNSHKEKQLSAPWVGAIIARQRHELFEVAMVLHKAFVDAAAQPIRHNLNLFMDSFGMTSFGDAAKDEVIPHLWSTLFLLVPVLSTTFASVGRMLKNIDAENLGWLLIDEAGQAIPQAAVGALMRTNKAVIVGDPIQIEPVVSLPETLTESICRQFGVDPLHYNAPSASAQTLADESSVYYASFETGHGTREVGVPLLVHRRCSSPMFDISNFVAYENLMVQAKVAKASPIMKVLGNSSWIHLVSRSNDKWCHEEGEKVINLLRQLKEHGCNPDLYIVTPFRLVQDKLRILIRESKVLYDWVENPNDWFYNRVGTVHTVQGREAEAVIFVLGAPS